jgi:DNA-binding CsgD family transcriptional regulator
VLAAATFMVDPGASRPLFSSSLKLARASGDRWAEADSLQFLGFSHLLQHRPAPSRDLLAQSGALADEMGNAFQQAWQHIASGTAKAYGGELADAARELRTGIGIARRPRGERRRPSFGWDSLTPTELEVVRLAAAGLTNPAIGEQLFISRGTVKTHLLHVFAKLGVHTRAELAVAATRRGLG